MSIKMADFPHEPIESLEANRSVDSVYNLTELDQRVKKNGDPYFSMTLGDKTGSLQAVMWDGVDAMLSRDIVAGHYVRIQGFLGEFREALQLTVQKIERVADDSVDEAMFRQASPRPRAEMEAELDEWITRVKNPDCRRLLEYMFHEESFRERFCMAPAAARVHQAYLHGLLEHTLAVMQLAWGISNLYKPINQDLLITGALLHDCGKVRELDWKRKLGYTDQGRMLGHIFIGATMVDRAVRTLEETEKFDRLTHDLILHMILSHHGKLEYGSPALPKTREALVLHYADYTEAYMAAFSENTNKSSARGEVWTPYNKMFQSYLFTGVGMPAGFEGEPEESGGTDPLDLVNESRPDPFEDISGTGDSQ